MAREVRLSLVLTALSPISKASFGEGDNTRKTSDESPKGYEVVRGAVKRKGEKVCEGCCLLDNLD